MNSQGGTSNASNSSGLNAFTVAGSQITNQSTSNNNASQNNYDNASTNSGIDDESIQKLEQLVDKAIAITTQESIELEKMKSSLDH
ncbi:hypothetical protein [Paenibacillus aceris]|uniref:Uncharacterized protein n=1 Tax=Paenibacillus aceris TaxID=869555 RepID=A0ABS4I869_9BACL|nr:hypothetical protein [Paenibacillus aceris]MBP1967127.1 hypothetical protein [Paenibacillus aceris]NHW35537.1 hypothetical protein [Paenibacillus aceris]